MYLSTENPFAFLVDILSSIVVFIFMLRLLFQLVRADIRNPISQTILKFSNPVLLPMRRVIPSIGRIDTASLLAMFLVQMLGLFLIGVINGVLIDPLTLLPITLLSLVRALLQFYFITLLAEALMSWLNPDPYNPAVSMLKTLNAPLLSPVRRMLPSTGGIDFSVMIVMIIILFLKRVVG